MDKELIDLLENIESKISSAISFSNVLKTKKK